MRNLDTRSTKTMGERIASSISIVFRRALGEHTTAWRAELRLRQKIYHRENSWLQMLLLLNNWQLERLSQRVSHLQLEQEKYGMLLIAYQRGEVPDDDPRVLDTLLEAKSAMLQMKILQASLANQNHPGISNFDPCDPELDELIDYVKGLMPQASPEPA